MRYLAHLMTVHTILHLTDGGRGGLEHTNSQTSMVPKHPFSQVM